MSALRDVPAALALSAMAIGCAGDPSTTNPNGIVRAPSAGDPSTTNPNGINMSNVKQMVTDLDFVVRVWAYNNERPDVQSVEVTIENIDEDFPAGCRELERRFNRIREWLFENGDASIEYRITMRTKDRTGQSRCIAREVHTTANKI